MTTKTKSSPIDKHGVITTGPNDPIIVHGWRMNDETSPFPTHTHGNALKGLPEFFIDPLAFGAEGNAQRIDAISRYLSQNANRHLLDAVHQETVVRIAGKDLFPNDELERDRAYYVLKVSRNFEGAKMAYPLDEDLGLPEGTELDICQIWVEGDDCVISDDYYRGGIRW